MTHKKREMPPTKKEIQAHFKRHINVLHTFVKHLTNHLLGPRRDTCVLREEMELETVSFPAGQGAPVPALGCFIPAWGCCGATRRPLPGLWRKTVNSFRSRLSYYDHHSTHKADVLMFVLSEEAHG